ncbi:integrase catalytic domain-containing protein [Nephila pilipes]|uniref:Integrase catalytic domain-containing protein n=1 Tax=Nephila pilipes TaxID=299642 RepID=A0A8X6TEK8_NEPPI|nr:integrase catalytic domain-containing protein [Nephila pilipes]
MEYRGLALTFDFKELSSDCQTSLLVEFDKRVPTVEFVMGSYRNYIWMVSTSYRGKKACKKKLGNNKEAALRHFKGLVQRFKRDPVLHKEYREVVDNYREEGIVERCVTEGLVDEVCDRRVETALKITTESVEILKNAGMALRKWHTNSGKLCEVWRRAGIETQEDKTIETGWAPTKVPGLAWDPDMIFFWL